MVRGTVGRFWALSHDWALRVKGQGGLCPYRDTITQVPPKVRSEEERRVVLKAKSEEVL